MFEVVGEWIRVLSEHLPTCDTRIAEVVSQDEPSASLWIAVSKEAAAKALSLRPTLNPAASIVSPLARYPSPSSVLARQHVRHRSFPLPLSQTPHPRHEPCIGVIASTPPDTTSVTTEDVGIDDSDMVDISVEGGYVIPSSLPLPPVVSTLPSVPSATHALHEATVISDSDMQVTPSGSGVVATASPIGSGNTKAASPLRSRQDLALPPQPVHLVFTTTSNNKRKVNARAALAAEHRVDTRNA